MIKFRAAAVCLLFALGTLALGVSGPVSAQAVDPFENGWTLDGEASALRFTSVKKGNVAETSSFASLSGLIGEDGTAKIQVLLDSVDTKIDLRNVRMRFLFFETFLHPEATIVAQLDPTTLQDLHQVRRKVVPLTYTLNLRGISHEKTIDVAVTLINNDSVHVASTAPVPILTADFDLEGGREKLQEAANVTIVPLGLISFDLVFNRASPGTPPAAQTAAATAGASAALETEGTFGRDEPAAK